MGTQVLESVSACLMAQSHVILTTPHGGHIRDTFVRIGLEKQVLSSVNFSGGAGHCIAESHVSVMIFTFFSREVVAVPHPDEWTRSSEIWKDGNGYVKYCVLRFVLSSHTFVSVTS